MEEAASKDSHQKKRIDNCSAKKQSQCCGLFLLDLYRARSRIKPFFNRDEQWRQVATPEDKLTASNFAVTPTLRQPRNHNSPSAGTKWLTNPKTRVFWLTQLSQIVARLIPRLAVVFKSDSISDAR